MTKAELAEPAHRLVARLIDILIVGLPVALIAPAFLPAEPEYWGARSADTAIAIGVAMLYLPYETIQVALWGRTIGKRLTGVAIVATAGAAPIGLRRAVLRAAVFALPIAMSRVPVLGAVAGLFWVVNAAWVLEPARRALHDRLAGTLVVRADRLARRSSHVRRA